MAAAAALKVQGDNRQCEVLEREDQDYVGVVCEQVLGNAVMLFALALYL